MEKENENYHPDLDLHKSQLFSLFTTFKSYCKNEDPSFFKAESNKEGTKTSIYKDPLTSLPVIKAERLIKQPSETIFNLLVMDDEATKEWDSDCEVSLVFSAIENKFFYGYYRLKGQSLLDPRDFPYISSYYEEGDDTYIVSKSYEDKEIPSFNKCVRAELYLMGYGLFPINAKETMVKFVLHLNYKGNLPKFIFSMMASSLGESLCKIDKYLQKHKSKEKLSCVYDKTDIIRKYIKK